MNSTDDPRKTASLFRDNGEKKHSKHASWHVRIRTEWNPFRLARKAERRGYEKGHAEGHAEGLREGYAPRVLDQDKAHLTESGGYFIGPVTVEAEGDTGDWDVIFHFGADAFKLRQQDAVSLDIEFHTAIYDGPDTYEEDIDAAMKARIEEDGWS